MTLKWVEYCDEILHTHWYWQDVPHEIVKWHLRLVEFLPRFKFWKKWDYCKPLYFHVYFISRFCDLRLFRGNLNSRCMMFSYLNSIHANISRECWIREGSNSRILAKIKFSRIIVNLQYCKMTFIIGRGFASAKFWKSENSLISWTEWNILIDFCVNIDIDKI